MLGWESTQARDADEAIVNGYCDEDLGGLEASIARRRELLRYPACPICGEPIQLVHEHDSLRIERLET